MLEFHKVGFSHPEALAVESLPLLPWRGWVPGWGPPIPPRSMGHRLGKPETPRSGARRQHGEAWRGGPRAWQLGAS